MTFNYQPKWSISQTKAYIRFYRQYYPDVYRLMKSIYKGRKEQEREQERLTLVDRLRGNGGL